MPPFIRSRLLSQLSTHALPRASSQCGCGRPRRLLSTANAPRRVEALRVRIAQEGRDLADFVSNRPADDDSDSPAPPTPRRLLDLRPPSRVAAALVDRFARQHTYLRLSLTERCSLRCTYCMPEEGVQLTAAEKLLTSDEIVRLAAVFVGGGVNKIRLTGGEPTVRRDLLDVVGALDQLRPAGLEQIAMTSNGIALPRMLRRLQAAGERRARDGGDGVGWGGGRAASGGVRGEGVTCGGVAAAGLDRLNVSLDTLDRELFTKLTRRDGLERVLAAIDLAIELGYTPLKVNCVLMAGVNEHELLSFAALATERPIDVRFIEYMPFDGNQWKEAGMVPHARVMETLRGAYPELTPAGNDAHDVAVSWIPQPGARGTVSLISSMTQPFCGGCNRLRLTADGNLKTCLFGADELSLRDAMRAGASDQELLALVGTALQGKHARHAGMHYRQLVSNENRPMTTIGG